MTDEELEARFTHHAPKEGQAELYERLRASARELAEAIDAFVPESREKALAFTNLEQAMFWANAAVARRG